MSIPLILLPGSMCDDRLFAHQLANLETASYRAITTADSIEALAHDVLATAPERFAVAGLSMGGIVAAQIAALAPSRLLGLALVDTKLEAPGSDFIERRRSQASEVRAGHLHKLLGSSFVNSQTVAPDLHRDLILDMALAMGPGVFLRQNEAILSRPDLRHVLTGLDVPVLVACGAHDTVCPPELHRELASLAPNSRLCVVDGAAHLSTIDRPEVLTRELAAWLDVCANNHPWRDTHHEFQQA